jgi:hypothetical protein
MALWNGTALNDNATSTLVNKAYQNQAINIVSETNGLLYALRNEDQKLNARKAYKMQRVEAIGGDKLRVRLFGKLSTIATVADGAAELVPQTPSYEGAAYGAAVFDLTHFFQTFGVPSSEYRRFVGNEAMTANWLVEKSQEFKAAKNDTLHTLIDAATAAAGTRTVLGNWQQAVSDGVTNVAGFNETLFASYGTISRTDAANVDYRGNLKDINGALTLDHLAEARLKCGRKNSMAQGADLVLAGDTQFLRLQSLIEAKNQVMVQRMEDWVQFGGQYFGYGGMTVTYDPKLASNVIGVLDTSTWLYWGDKEFRTSGWKESERASGMIIKHDSFEQLICLSPQNNWKGIRLT